MGERRQNHQGSYLHFCPLNNHFLFYFTQFCCGAEVCLLTIFIFIFRLQRRSLSTRGLVWCVSGPCTQAVYFLRAAVFGRVISATPFASNLPDEHLHCFVHTGVMVFTLGAVWTTKIHPHPEAPFFFWVPSRDLTKESCFIYF